MIPFFIRISPRFRHHSALVILPSVYLLFKHRNNLSFRIFAPTAFAACRRFVQCQIAFERFLDISDVLYTFSVICPGDREFCMQNSCAAFASRQRQCSIAKACTSPGGMRIGNLVSYAHTNQGAASWMTHCDRRVTYRKMCQNILKNQEQVRASMQ